VSALPLLALLQQFDPQVEATGNTSFVVGSLVKIVLVFSVYMVVVALLTLAERKISAWIQDRRGPNRAGYGGLLQPAADGVKNFMKEETYPSQAYLPLFVLAPAIAFIPALVTWAVIPIAAPWPSPWWGLQKMVVADLPIGFLFTLAIASLGVYGIVLAGWSSNNKYALLGGLRSSGQMVSYEIAMGMSTIPVLMLAGNVALSDIVRQQQAIGWNVFLLTIAFFTFLVAAFAETNRLPFDLPEAESELVAGYHTEYSGMKFSMFFIAEYANMLTASALLVTLFFGGYDVPFTSWDDAAPWTGWKTLATLVVFVAKVLFFIFFYMWIRWTLPRFRYDQLMALGWKFMLPLALAYIVIIAAATLALDAAGIARTGMFGVILFGINVVLCVLVFFVLDRGRLISPASSRARFGEVERLRAIAASRSPGGVLPRGVRHGESVASDAGD
jgi:NADH-quinone oxidoreductase subunit H